MYTYVGDSWWFYFCPGGPLLSGTVHHLAWKTPALEPELMHINPHVNILTATIKQYWQHVLITTTHPFTNLLLVFSYKL